MFDAKMMGPNVRLISCFVAAAVLACNEADSGSGSGAGSGTYQSVTEDSAADIFAREYCGLLLDRCDCDSAQRVFQSRGQCQDGFAMQLQSDFAEAQAAGLEYDPNCMGQYVNLFTQDLACHTRGELTMTVITALNAPTCKVHYGTAAQGEACESYYTAFGDTCAQGLTCAGTCIVNRIQKQEGDACDAQTDTCEGGTYCSPTEADPAGPASCLRWPGKGEACVGACDTGLVCETDLMTGQGICTSPPSAGSPCAQPPTECAPDAYCDAGTCVPILPTGSPCSDPWACGVGNQCTEVQDGQSDVCRPEGPLVCF